MTDAEVIGEFRARQQAGHYGDRALLMDADRDYSGMWSALMDHIPAWEQRFGFDSPVLFEVRSTIHRLADARPNAVEIFALNTARYGRENLGRGE